MLDIADFNLQSYCTRTHPSKVADEDPVEFIIRFASLVGMLNILRTNISKMSNMDCIDDMVDMAVYQYLGRFLLTHDLCIIVHQCLERE